MLFFKSLIFIRLLSFALSHEFDENCFKNLNYSSPLHDEFEFPKVNFIVTQQRQIPIGHGVSQIIDVRTDQFTLRKNTTQIVEYISTIDSALSYNPRELFVTFLNNSLNGIMSEIYFNETVVDNCRGHFVDVDVHTEVKDWLMFFEEEIIDYRNVSRDLLKLQILDQYIPVGPDEDSDCVEIATYPKFNLNLPTVDQPVDETTLFRLINIKSFTDTSGNVKKTTYEELPIHLHENDTKVVGFARHKYLSGSEDESIRNLTVTLLPDKRVSAIIGLMKEDFTVNPNTLTWECSVKVLDYDVQNAIDVDFYIESSSSGVTKNFIRIEKDNGGSILKCSMFAFVLAFCLKILF